MTLLVQAFPLNKP